MAPVGQEASGRVHLDSHRHLVAISSRGNDVVVQLRHLRLVTDSRMRRDSDVVEEAMQTRSDEM